MQLQINEKRGGRCGDGISSTLNHPWPPKRWKRKRKKKKVNNYWNIKKRDKSFPGDISIAIKLIYKNKNCPNNLWWAVLGLLICRGRETHAAVWSVMVEFILNGELCSRLLTVKGSDFWSSRHQILECRMLHTADKKIKTKQFDAVLVVPNQWICAKLFLMKENFKKQRYEVKIEYLVENRNMIEIPIFC